MLLESVPLRLFRTEMPQSAKEVQEEFGQEGQRGRSSPAERESPAEKGKLAFHEGKFDRALELFNEAIKEDSKNFAAFSNRSVPWF